jgi:hypothetical protein
MTMGKVIPLDLNTRKRASAQTELGARTFMSRIGRAAISMLVRVLSRSAFAAGRELLLACSAMLNITFAVIARLLRPLVQLSAVTVVISIGLEYFDRWRHLQLIFVAATALGIITVLGVGFERLTEGATGLQSKLRGRRV